MRKLVIAVAICGSLSSAEAQNTDIESLAGLLFNFSNPGARSLAMGGAFIGLADDASAAEANPAGLTVLRKPEISLEVRNYEQKQFLTTSGTFPDFERTGFSLKNRLIQPTFASFVYPMKHFAIGAYYHEALRNKAAGEVIPERNAVTGAITKNVPNFYLPRGGPGPVSRADCDAIRVRTNDFFSCLEYTVIPFLSTIDLKERTLGVVGAYKFSNVSVGLTARYQRLAESASSTDFTSRFDVSSLRVQTTGDGRPRNVGKNENDLTFSLGVKWTPTDSIGVGAIYKQGAKFSSAMFVAAPSSAFNLVKIADTTFHVPDIYGIGASLRPIPVLTLNVDAVRITYANLIDNFQSFDFLVQKLDSPYKVSNATEIHVGAEYFFRARVPFAVRAGWWRDPAHNLEFRGPLTEADYVAAALLFPKGSAQRHLSVGAGWSWPRFEIDAAYDWSKINKVACFSVVERF